LSSDSPTPLQPVARRALELAGVLSLLLIAVVLNSLLHGGSESPFNPNPVAAAAERTQEVPGMRIVMTMRVSTESAPPTTITGNGVYNGEENLAQVTYHIKTPQGTSLESDAVLGEGAWYFRYPAFASKMPEGKEWLKMEGLPGQSEMSQTGESPQDSLQMLSAAGSVKRLGQARVHGVSTTRYHVTITAAGMVTALHSEGKDELAEEFETTPLAEPIQAEVFVDQHGMLRRMNTMTTAIADGKNVTAQVHMDLSDFGIRPHIQLPDDSQVLDLGPALEEQLGKLGQSS
jgi:hypothetical protein